MLRMVLACDVVVENMAKRCEDSQSRLLELQAHCFVIALHSFALTKPLLMSDQNQGERRLMSLKLTGEKR
eukprot:4620875-Amphidinium_carterae.1